jgi:hypothetical protein
MRCRLVFWQGESARELRLFSMARYAARLALGKKSALTFP